jgi:hypothetical protein
MTTQVQNTTSNDEIPTPWKQVPNIDPPLFVKADEWFVDFQYYKFADGVIFPKEFSVLNMFNETKSLNFIAKSPSNYNAYAPENMKTGDHQYNLHKTQWEDGNVENWEAKLKNLINQGDPVYVRGEEKEKFLKSFGFDAIDLGKMQCPSITNLYKGLKISGHSLGVDKCAFHTANKGLCTWTNVHILRRWYRLVHNTFDVVD